MSYRPEADVVMALLELHSADEMRARSELSRELVRVRSRAPTRPNMGLAGIALLGIAGLALALLLPGFHTGSGASSMASGAAGSSGTTTESSSLASTLAEPSASSSETPFPSTVEGRDVLNGQAALSQMLAGPSDLYLVGGWVRIVMVDGYSYSGTNVLFFPTDPEGASATAANAVRLEGLDVLQLPQNRPMVLEVQLDPACNDQQGPCPILMVKRVVWTQS